MSNPDVSEEPRASALRRGWLIYAAAFLSGKATAFLGPIALAYLSDESTYGLIELAYGYGLLLGPLLTLGVVIAAPQHMLIESDDKVIDRMAISVLGAAVAGLGTAWLFINGNISLWNQDTDIVTLSALMIAPLAVQIALSTYSRTKGWKSAAAWLDNTSTHLMWIIGIVLFLHAGLINLGDFRNIYVTLNILIVGLSLYFAIRYYAPPLTTRYRHSLKIGFPMMMNGVAIFLVTGSSRILIGSFIGPEALAGYAFVFRISGAILLIHQFLMTAWAVQIYRDESSEIDRHLMWFAITMSVSAAVILIGFLLPPVQPLLPDFINTQDVALVGLTVCQILLWSLSACLEPRINRLLKAGRMALITFSVAIAMILLIAAAAWMNIIGVKGIIAAICVAQSALIAFQLKIVREQGDAGLPRTAKAMLFGPLGILCLTAILESFR